MAQTAPTRRPNSRMPRATPGSMAAGGATTHHTPNATHTRDINPRHPMAEGSLLFSKSRRPRDKASE